MYDKYNINSILNAINEINIKPKKKKITIEKRIIPKLNQDLKIPPDIDRLIQEAEKYKKKSALKSPQEVSIQSDEAVIKLNNYNKTFAETQAQVIDELYSKFTKKVKKNTLKIIFNLHLKIKDLEKQLEDSQIKKNQSQSKNKLILKDEVVESPKIQDPSITNLNKVLSNNKNTLSNEVVTSLKIQDTTIAILNEKINNFKKTEEALQLQIIDLSQDKTLLLNKIKKFNESSNRSNYNDSTKKILNFIYKQVEKQKKVFLNLKNYSLKIERDAEFFKENYEKSIVEKKEIKKRLEISKEKMVVYENNKLDLLSSIHQLNEILSKTNVAANISPLKKPLKDNNASRKKAEIDE
ncbi:MAG: hypothetical protein FD549_000377 [Pelagibacterales bacterium]|nr:hypothetical protein [Pelagibacterales bacterium]